MKPYILLGLFVVALGACTNNVIEDSGRYELPATGAGDNIITYSCTMNGVEKIAYTVCFDETNKIPRWVAYDLTEVEMEGTAKRNGKEFRPDEDAGVEQAQWFDYKRSGWTKGHMAPAGDFRWSDEAMDDTFYFTNCCPQDKTMNAHSWEKLERKARDWAIRFGTIYIVTGPIVGDAENGAIGEGRITVPDAFFKAVLARDGEKWQAVAFIMENSPIDQPYPDCAVSVDQLEEITGLDLYTLLDDRVEKETESHYDLSFWR